jgi:hypothetical protein
VSLSHTITQSEFVNKPTSLARLPAHVPPRCVVNCMIEQEFTMHNASDRAKFLPKRVFPYLTGGYGSQQLTYELVATGKETGVA